MLKNFIYTTKVLLNDPKSVINGFIYAGNRSYLHPFPYLITGIVVVTLLNTLFIDFSEISLSFTFDDSQEQSVEQIGKWIEVVTLRMSTQFLQLSLLILIPLLSVSGTFFFREHTDGFYSNLILNSYFIGVVNGVLLLLIPIWILSGVSLSHPFLSVMLPGVLIGFTLLWMYHCYFKINSMMGWIRAVSTIISGYIFYYFLTGFLAGVIGYMIFAVNRIIELSGAV